MPFELLAPDDARLAPRLDLADGRAQVEAYAATDADQRDTRQQILRFLDEHPDALLRSCRDGHLTGSALVLDDAFEQVMLLFHRKAQRWLQPGGHADGDANLAAVAHREATEETGLDRLRVAVPAVDVDIHRVHFTGEQPHLHLDVRFLVLAPAGVDPVGNDESEAVRWVPLDQLDAYGLDPGTLRLARAGRQVAAALR